MFNDTIESAICDDDAKVIEINPDVCPQVPLEAKWTFLHNIVACTPQNEGYSYNLG
jgi:hypothetical protein